MMGATTACPAAAVRERMAGLLSDLVAVDVAIIGENAGRPMFHVKHHGTEGMVPSRRQEFLAGRLAAHRAQARLGLEPRGIGSGPDRAPVWPRGLTGSISHAAGIAVAAVARTDRVLALGIDLEPDAPLEPEIAKAILLPEEEALLGQGGAAGGRTVFSAKEAVYKALYPLNPEVAGYDLLSIRPDSAGGAFSARLTRRYGPFAEGSQIAGRLAVAGGLILSAVCICR